MAKRATWFRSVELDDLAEMRVWAELLARGETLDSMAARMKVEATTEAVVGKCTEGMSPEACRVVTDAFRQEFERTRQASTGST